MIPIALNPSQRCAVQDPAARLVVQAGAGSGKTAMLLARTQAELQRAAQAHLFAFNRAAARELRERLARLGLTEAELARVEVTTIHAHAAEVCGQDLPRADANFAQGFSIVSEADRQVLTAEAKAAHTTPDQLLTANGLLTYDDLLTRGLALLQARAGCPDLAVLVDEAQDLTAAEWSWIRANRPARLTVVGDASQQIYGWRGAIEGVLVGPDRVRHDVPRELLHGATWHTLPRNYRSRPEILKVANRLDIPGRVTLEADRESGGTVAIAATATDGDLFAGLLARWGGWDGDPGDWAVLSRTKGRLQGLYDACTAEGLPVHAPALEPAIWDQSPAARALVDLLQVVAHPHDSLHLARCLTRAGMTRAQLLRAEHERTGLRACSLWNWLSAHETDGGPAHRLLVALHEAQELQYDVRAVARRLRELGYVEPTAPLALLPDRSVSAFLLELASPEREETAAPAGAVTLSTIHGAKGREWPRVLVLGCEEGHWPSPRSALAEERRLAYVAITRAKEELVLHHSSVRPGWQGRGTQDSRPSRFLTEVGLGTEQP